jgi:hypothetical protein
MALTANKLHMKPRIADSRTESRPASQAAPVRLVRPGTGNGTGATSISPNFYRPWYDGTAPAPQGPPHSCVQPVEPLCSLRALGPCLKPPARLHRTKSVQIGRSRSKSALSIQGVTTTRASLPKASR